MPMYSLKALLMDKGSLGDYENLIPHGTLIREE